jgi:hypothetical protein
MRYNKGNEIAIRVFAAPMAVTLNRRVTMPHKYTPEEHISVFWSNVNKNGSIPEHCPELGNCWEWTASHHRQGYGNYTYKGKYILCHRLSWILTNGDPQGLCVLHKCDNTACVRPDHLFLGTQVDNIHDRNNKGRQGTLFGEESGSAKLTDIQVEAIRQRRAETGLMYKVLAKEFGVSISTIGKIVTKRHTKR